LGASSEPLSLYSTSPPLDGVRSGLDGLRFNSATSGRASRGENGSRDDPFGDAWSLSTALTYTRRNSSFGVALEGSHGVHLHSSFPRSTGAAVGLLQPSFADVTGSRVWDARLMTKHRLFGSNRRLSGDVFAEGVLRLNRNVLGLSDTDLPASFRPIRSRSFRFGIVLSY
jgi:hypothetical protein